MDNPRIGIEDPQEGTEPIVHLWFDLPGCSLKIEYTCDPATTVLELQKLIYLAKGMAAELGQGGARTPELKPPERQGFGGM